MILYQVAIAGLAFFAVLCLAASILLWNGERKKTIQLRLQDTSNTLLDESSYQSSTPPFLGWLGLVGNMISFGGASKSLRMTMLQAGFNNQVAVSVFLGIKLLLLVLSLVACASFYWLTDFSLHIKAMVFLIGTAFAFFTPNMILRMFCRRRALEVQRHLPNMVDLLEVCVTGGMGIDMAWNSVAVETRRVCPVLADEMALANLEMHLGEERGAAIRHMAERTGSEDLANLVAVLVQSEKFGTSISEALVVFAESMREIRSQRAEEAAEQMTVKMLFPMIVFIFPVELIVAVAPAVLTLIELLGSN